MYELFRNVLDSLRNMYCHFLSIDLISSRRIMRTQLRAYRCSFYADYSFDEISVFRKGHSTLYTSNNLSIQFSINSIISFGLNDFSRVLHPLATPEIRR